MKERNKGKTTATKGLPRHMVTWPPHELSFPQLIEELMFLMWPRVALSFPAVPGVQERKDEDARIRAAVMSLTLDVRGQ